MNQAENNVENVGSEDNDTGSGDTGTADKDTGTADNDTGTERTEEERPTETNDEPTITAQDAPPPTDTPSNQSTKTRFITSNHSLQDQKEFFKIYSRNNVVTIVQANSGYIDILSNMFCTLLATNPEYLKGTILGYKISNKIRYIIYSS